MYYRSDWPEIGWLESCHATGVIHHQQNSHWIQESVIAGICLQWVVTRNDFETNLYNIPIWNLHVEIDDLQNKFLSPQFKHPTLQEAVNESIQQLLSSPPWDKTAYISSKVVKDEPLYHALLQSGFEEIEHRRLYHCQIQDIVGSRPTFHDTLALTSLAEIPTDQHEEYQAQILDICRETFGTKGYSRHYTDPILLQKLPGIAYTLAVMQLNFEQIDPAYFFVAIDTATNILCGFSVIGRKPDLGENRYTQLLSAVRQTYWGQGIYRGLTHLLSQRLPGEAMLLNVTHTANLSIQRAYQNSGRLHLADTVVLRKFYNTL